MPTRVTIWSENWHERTDPAVAAMYPIGIHGAIAEGLAQTGLFATRTATLDQVGQGLGGSILEETDVLCWWGHKHHAQVEDALVERIAEQVRHGMGLLILHSGAQSKVFAKLMGTTGAIDGWRHGGRELVWTVSPSHPIARGVPHPIIVPNGEMYSEPFDVPPPEEVVFINSYSGGEVLRSGMTFRRGHGRIFYFSPGHEEHPVYYQPEIRRVLTNAVEWAAPPAEVSPRPSDRERPLGWFEPYQPPCGR